jgi:hypothetical protein
LYTKKNEEHFSQSLGEINKYFSSSSQSQMTFNQCFDIVALLLITNFNEIREINYKGMSRDPKTQMPILPYIEYVDGMDILITNYLIDEKFDDFIESKSSKPISIRTIDQVYKSFILGIDEPVFNRLRSETVKPVTTSSESESVTRAPEKVSRKPWVSLEDKAKRLPLTRSQSKQFILPTEREIKRSKTEMTEMTESAEQPKNQKKSQRPPKYSPINPETKMTPERYIQIFENYKQNRNKLKIPHLKILINKNNNISNFNKNRLISLIDKYLSNKQSESSYENANSYPTELMDQNRSIHSNQINRSLQLLKKYKNNPEESIFKNSYKKLKELELKENLSEKNKRKIARYLKRYSKYI